MKTNAHPRTTNRLLSIVAAALAIALAGVIAAHLAATGSPAADLSETLFGDLRDVHANLQNRVDHQGPPGAPDDTTMPRADAIDERDGVLPDGVSVFDDDYAGVAGLEPDLLQALRSAATAAANDGVVFFVTSGWRSAAYQTQLLQEAVTQYGSETEAARWVASPEKSAHVSGEAVDLGPADATSWLATHGAAYGLCQVYGNEPWHFELRPEAVTNGCPPTYADPTQDPRMQQ